jgi:hypothetical protein
MGMFTFGRGSADLFLTALFLSACIGQPTPPPGGSEPPPFVGQDGLSLGQEVQCSAPTEGFNRLTQEAASRGLVGAGETGDLPWASHASVSAVDLDNDGDIDLGFATSPPAVNDGSGPVLFSNDGTGQFEQVQDAYLGTAVSDLSPGVPGFVDLDGDRLPELVLI